MYELAQKIKELRNKNGYSQEDVSEKTGLSLRTIQRIENGETEPRGDSIKRLATLFDLTPEDLFKQRILSDRGFLVGFNLSALSFLIFPILGVIVPLLLWMMKKDKIKNLSSLAKRVVNFQITWIIVVSIIGLIITIKHFSLFFNTVALQEVDFKAYSGIFFYATILVGSLYLLNVILIIVSSVRIHKGKSSVYYPTINFVK